MQRAVLSISLGCVSSLFLVAGCSSDDDAEDGAPAADDGADDGEDSDTGEVSSDTSTGGTETGAAEEDESSSGEEGGSTGAVEPPPVDCGAGETLTGSLEINDDDDVAQLDGIAILTGDLIISGTSYTNLDFLSCLEEIQGNIQIFNNPSLVDMTGTNTLTKIGRLPANTPTPTDPDFWDAGTGSIAISGNQALLEIDGFTGITAIGEQPERGEDACPGAPRGLECASRQSLVIRDNNAATGVTGFTSLELIFASLTVQQNESLMHIDGFESLIGVGGAFAVSNNPNLCMSSVNAIGGGLEFLGDEDSSITVGNDEDC